MSRPNRGKDPFDILDSGHSKKPYDVEKDPFRKKASGKKSHQKEVIFTLPTAKSAPAKSQTPKKKKAPRKKKRVLRAVLATVLCVAIGGGILGALYLKNLNDTLVTKPLEGDLQVTQGLSEQVVNIALFGIDARQEGGSARSDSMMILSIDEKNKAIKISSLMRDSYVQIDGYGYTKLNHSYAYGGPSLAVATINKNFDLNITHYATVDFSQMSNIIDAVGGIEIDVPANELASLNHNMIEQNEIAGTKVPNVKQSGLQLLNGTQAVAYSRIRDVGNGDFQRTERQRIVMMTLMNKLLSQPITKYPSLAKTLLGMCETDFTIADFPTYLPFVLKKPKIYQNRFPQDGDYQGKLIGGTYYMTYNDETTINKLHDFIYNYSGEPQNP